MADVIGPNSYLPGQELKVPEGVMCDEHEDRPDSVHCRRQVRYIREQS